VSALDVREIVETNGGVLGGWEGLRRRSAAGVTLDLAHCGRRTHRTATPQRVTLFLSFPMALFKRNNSSRSSEDQDTGEAKNKASWKRPASASHYGWALSWC